MSTDALADFSVIVAPVSRCPEYDEGDAASIFWKVVDALPYSIDLKRPSASKRDFTVRSDALLIVERPAPSHFVAVCKAVVPRSVVEESRRPVGVKLKLACATDAPLVAFTLPSCRLPQPSCPAAIVREPSAFAVATTRPCTSYAVALAVKLSLA